MRENKAITLIALVVTIIVLLILASVSLNLVLGEHGIITMAKAAKENMELAQVQEQAELNQLYEQLYNGSSGGTGNNGDLGNPEGNTGDSGNTGESGEADPSELTGQNITKKNYGRYVDYGLDINGNTDTTDDWRIFYTNDDGRIFLIAANFVPNTCESLQIAIDVNHANMIANDSYDLYEYFWSRDNIPTYNCNDGHNKTLNQNKVQCSFPNLFMPSGDFCESTDHFYCSDHVSDGLDENRNARCAAALQCTTNWSSFVTKSTKSQYADYAIGGPTIEMWIASWNKVHGATTETDTKGGITLFATGKSGGRGYYVGTVADCKEYYYSLSEIEGYNDPLYFPDKTSNKCFGYWLASPSAKNGDASYILGVDCFGIIDGSQYDYKGGYSVRPVVCLKEDVKLTKDTERSTETKAVYNLSMATE